MALQSTTVRLDENLLERAKAAAKRDHRSLTATIAMLLERYAADSEAGTGVQTQVPTQPKPGKPRRKVPA